LSKAEEALLNNSDEELVEDKVQAVMDAQGVSDNKYVIMVRAQEYFHTLEQEYHVLSEARRIKMDEKIA